MRVNHDSSYHKITSSQSARLLASSLLSQCFPWECVYKVQQCFSTLLCLGLHFSSCARSLFAWDGIVNAFSHWQLSSRYSSKGAVALFL